MAPRRSGAWRLFEMGCASGLSKLTTKVADASFDTIVDNMDFWDNGVLEQCNTPTLQKSITPLLNSMFILDADWVRQLHCLQP